MTNKDKIEEMCRAAGMKPADRRMLKGYDLLMSDGFSLPPHKAFARFGVGPNDFPNGCYVTFWWLMRGEENMLAAHPLIFDVHHNPEYDPPTKKQGRINSAFEDAENFIKTLETIH